MGNTTEKTVVEAKIRKDKIPMPPSYGNSNPSDLKFRTIDLKFLDGGTINVEYWPTFYNYITQELNANRQPEIHIKSLGKFPLFIKYNGNHKHYCSISVIVFMAALGFASIAMLF